MVFIDCSTCDHGDGYGPRGYVLVPSTVWPGTQDRNVCPDCGGARRFVDTTGTDNLTVLIDKVIAEGGTGEDVLTALDANRDDLFAYQREVGMLASTVWREVRRSGSHDGWGHYSDGERDVIADRDGTTDGRLYRLGQS